MEIKVKLSKGILYFTNGMEYNINTKVCTNSQTGEVITDYLPILAKHFDMEKHPVWNDWAFPNGYAMRHAKVEEERVTIYVCTYINWAVNRLDWTDIDIYDRFSQIITWWEGIYNIDTQYVRNQYSQFTDYNDLMNSITLQEFIKYCMPKRYNNEAHKYEHPSTLVSEYLFDKWVASLKLKIEIRNEDLWLIFNHIYRCDDDFSKAYPQFYRVCFNHLYTDIIPLCTDCRNGEINYGMVVNIFQNYLSAVHTLNLDEAPKTNNFLKYITDIIRMATTAKEKVNHEKCVALYEKYKLCETLETENLKVIIPKSLDDIKNESLVQKNCLYNSYLNDYIDGKYRIAFIRKKTDVSTPFITVGYWQEKDEIHLDQAHGKNNCNPYSSIVNVDWYAEYDELIHSIESKFYELLENEKEQRKPLLFFVQIAQDRPDACSHFIYN